MAVLRPIVLPAPHLATIQIAQFGVPVTYPAKVATENLSTIEDCGLELDCIVTQLETGIAWHNLSIALSPLSLENVRNLRFQIVL